MPPDLAPPDDGEQEPTRAQLQARIADLENKLASSPVIEQVKGALMATYGLSADAAFAMLRFQSMKRNIKLRTLAARIGDLMQTSPTPGQAVARFDRLLQDAGRPLPTPTPPPGDGPGRHRAGEGAENSRYTRAVTIAANVPDLPLIYANDAFTVLTGYPQDQILGRNCRFLQGPGTDPDAVAALTRALSHGRDVTVIMRNYRKGGAAFFNEVSISPIRNPIGQITHYVGTQTDLASA